MGHYDNSSIDSKHKEDSKMKLNKKQLFGLIASVIVLIGMNFVPTTTLLTVAGRNTIGLLVVMLIMFVTEGLPLPITCILLPSFLVLFGCVSIGEAYSGFSNHLMFFVLASFGISTAITKVNLSRRMLIALMNAFGGSVKRLLLAFMICSAIVSSMVSNIATATAFIPLIIDFLNLYPNEADRKKTGAAFMIGLTIANMIGGMMTPAGSSLNLLIMAQLETMTGISITFTQWMAFGLPISLVFIPLSWLIVVKLNPIVEVDKEDVVNYLSNIKKPGKWSSKEKLVAILISIMFVLWILSSWVSFLHVTVITTIFVFLMMVPQVGVFSWEDYKQNVSWEAYFMLGSVMCMGNALVSSNASIWFAETLMPSTLDLPHTVILIIVALLIFVLLIPIPVAPALIGMLSAPLIVLAGTTGISPIVMMMVLGLCVSNCYLLPLDPVPLITYLTGYYKMGQLTKTAIPHQLILAILTALWLPFAAKLMGIL